MSKHGTKQAGNISEHIEHWAKGNDWYHTDIQTNQLRLEQNIGLAIEAIAKDLDYQNQPQLRRQIFDCYDMLMGKCRQIDMVCRVGCRNEKELYELHFLKSKAIGAAAELADVLTLLNAKSETTDDTMREKYLDRINRINGIKETRSHVNPVNPVKGIHCVLAGSTAAKDAWMTFSEAAEVIGVTKGTISKWAAEGKFTDNGQKGQKRRLLKTSVLEVKLQKEDEDLKKDALDLRRDMRKLG